MKSVETIHLPVLQAACVELVTPALQKPQSVWVDCTLGLAGHALAMLKATAPSGAKLIGIDRDAQALNAAESRIEQAGFSDRFTRVHAPFDDFSCILDDLHIDSVQAVFLDLGLSSLQIDESDRGFSYAQDAPLDMRMDQRQTLTAQEILATYTTDELATIFKEYGQERFAYPIAKAIVQTRDTALLTSSRELNELVDRTIPKANRPSGNPAKRVFQALRIEVNGELEKLKSVLEQAVSRLSVGGRLVVESYHSLEDRMVKQVMNCGARPPIPQGIPQLTEAMTPCFKLLTRGALMAGDEEQAANPRSASVRLRAVEVIRPLNREDKERIHRILDSNTSNAFTDNQHQQQRSYRRAHQRNPHPRRLS